jgi:hypothetical protein
LEAALEHARFSSHPFHGITQFAAEVRDLDAPQMAPFAPFTRLPEALPRLQFRRIGRQAFHVHPLGRPIGEELLDEMTARNGGAIPHEHHPAGHLTEQVFQEGDHIRRIESAVLTLEIQFALRRHGTDRRQMVAGPPCPQDRGLAHGRVGAHHTRQGIKPRFVYEEDGLLRRHRPLLIAGHVSVRQRSLAASSRWRARRLGFWGSSRGL